MNDHINDSLIWMLAAIMVLLLWYANAILLR